MASSRSGGGGGRPGGGGRSGARSGSGGKSGGGSRGGSSGGGSRGGSSRGGSSGHQGSGGKKPGGGGSKPSRRYGPSPKSNGPGGRSRGPARRPGSTRRVRGLVVTPAEGIEVPLDDSVRLNKMLADAGECSRRTADEWIAGGRVAVDGDIVTELGVRVNVATQTVEVDGRKIGKEKPAYVLFNKPRGVVCTNAKGEQRPRAIDYMPGVRGRLYTVGRLDADSEGLVILTNDGDFTQKVSHPSHGVPKVYAVLLRGRIDYESLNKARGGVWLSEGRTRGADIRIARQSRDRTYLKIEIREGKNREIRRVFARLGFPVISLKRVRIGDLTLHSLRAGGWRFLRQEEVRSVLNYADRPEVDHGDDRHFEGNH